MPIKFKTISICEDKTIKFCSLSKKGYKKILWFVHVKLRTKYKKAPIENNKALLLIFEPRLVIIIIKKNKETLNSKLWPKNWVLLEIPKLKLNESSIKGYKLPMIINLKSAA